MIADVQRPTAYVIAPTNHGTMIINRFDYRETALGSYGVGNQLLNTQSFDQNEVNVLLRLLDLRRKHHGDGVVGLDLGANIGVHTIEWARHMFGWGEVFSVEAQKRIYYALAGNIAINNCFNAQAIWSAVSDQTGFITAPEPDYFTPSSYGSFELLKNTTNEDIGQIIDWSEDNAVLIPKVTVDSLNFKRIDLIKIDIEGMEEQAIKGAKKSLKKCNPIFVVERIKSNEKNIVSAMTSHGYRTFKLGINFLIINQQDPCLHDISGLEEVIF